jgi:hypothetical protein
MSGRGFPSPWTVDEDHNACFIVRDANGQALGYFLSKKILGDDQRASCSPKMRPEGSL